MKSKNSIIFNAQLFKNQMIPSVFSSLYYFGQTVANQHSLEVSPNQIYSFRLVPSYIHLNLKDPTLTSKTIKQENWGYAVYLKESTTVDDYLQKQFKYKYRSIIRRFITRLEACFPIKYSLFHGEISKEDYDFIMDSLEKMIIHRFTQRNEKHKEIHLWTNLKKTTFDKIRNKEASLFVIYHQKQPIEISLNYHFDKILFSAISSYDINYAKFGLGHIEIYKQIEWCLHHDYILFEMGVGGMDYKRRWSNTIYNFEHHIVYSNTNLLAKINGQIEVVKIEVKEYLKAKKLNEFIPILKNKFAKKSSNEEGLISNPIVKISEQSAANTFQGTEIQWQLSEYHLLKKHIFDFLYTTIEHAHAIKVYKMDAHEYYIVGKKSFQKITIN